MRVLVEAAREGSTTIIEEEAAAEAGEAGAPTGVNTLNKLEENKKIKRKCNSRLSLIRI